MHDQQTARSLVDIFGIGGIPQSGWSGSDPKTIWKIGGDME